MRRSPLTPVFDSRKRRGSIATGRTPGGRSISGSGARTQANQTAAGAGTTAITPSSISGLAGWYDASDAATLTASGSNLQTWADKSGHAPGRNLGSTGGQEPQTGTRTRNSHNVIEFVASATLNAGDNLLCLNPYIYNAGACTVFVVYLADIDPVDDNVAWLIYEGRGNLFTPEYGFHYGPQYMRGQHYNDAGTLLAAAQGATTDVAGGSGAHIARFTDTGSQLSLHIDGTLEATSSSYSRSTTSTSVLAVSKQPNANGDRGHDGWIAEIIVYDSVISSGSISGVEQYLRNKWAL